MGKHHHPPHPCHPHGVTYSPKGAIVDVEIKKHSVIDEMKALEQVLLAAADASAAVKNSAAEAEARLRNAAKELQEAIDAIEGLPNLP